MLFYGKKMSSSKVLVIGNYCQTITVIRSLARAGYYIIVGCDEKRVFTQYSRHTSEVWRHPDITKSEEDFIAALTKFLARRQDIALVFPSVKLTFAASCATETPSHLPLDW